MPELTPQQKRALDYKSHISLTANAGSGKTFVLSKRFVEIFLNEEIDIQNIVAITFTDKAAGELNKKIAHEIKARLSTAADEDQKRKLLNLQRQLVFANISTIHSFCINILKEFAPEAGLDVNFNPIDQKTSDELIELSVDETINGLIRDQEYSEDLKYLVRSLGSKNALAGQLENAFHKRRTLEQLTEAYSRKNENEIAAGLREIFEKDFGDIFAPRLGKVLDNMHRINELVFDIKPDNEIASGVLEGFKNYGSESSFCGRLMVLGQLKNLILTKTGATVKKMGYLNSGRDKVESEILNVESFFGDLGRLTGIEEPQASEFELARFGKKFIGVFNFANNLYTQKKKGKSQLDFDDMLIFVRKIIGINEVINSLRERYKYIMIDEYQDTNELQYEIFMPILDYLKTGNLFVVGDEKQSIYMFRNAEPEVFERTRGNIESMNEGGKALNLPHSFRMVGQLVLFANRLFSNLFADADPYFNEVDKNDLVCAKDDSENGEVEFLLAEEGTEYSESEMVASKIADLASGKRINYNEIAILCRKRELFSELEKTFAAHRIPYSIVGGKGFFRRQVIYDIYNYLSFLINNEDDTALVGILRSPFFNLSDLQIYEISLEESNKYFGKLKSKSKSAPELKPICELLDVNTRIAKNSEFYSLLRKLLSESNYWVVAAAKQNSDQEIANIGKLLGLSRDFSTKSFKNLFDLREYLRESIEGPEDEGQATIARDENTVKIMTIHQSKGLEFKNVFIYGCNEKSMEDGIRARYLIFDSKYGILTKIPSGKKYFEKSYAAPAALLYDYIMRRKNSAETKRLLYVAVTRAINRLIFSATQRSSGEQAGSFLGYLKEGLRSNLETDSFPISSDVEFMKFSGDKYNFSCRKVSLNIPVIKKIMVQASSETFDAPSGTEKKILTEIIKDKPENEIISATKISMYSQCPVKYELTYLLGYSTIYQMIRERRNEFEFNPNEEEELGRFAQLRGKLIHSVLKDRIPETGMRVYLKDKIDSEIITGKGPVKEKLVDAIITEVVQFYRSETFIQLSNRGKSMNEYEVYAREGEHYLYGIIDKLIIEKNRLVIVDYKTDNIKIEQVGGRASDYFAQLKFYAYILSKLYTSYSRFELLLVFLKHSGHPVKWEIGREELEEFGRDLDLAVRNIYAGQFKPNLNHCPKCHFASEGNKCIKAV